MDDTTLEILFFALLAAFICHRLWLVLGRRDGETPPARPDPFTIRDATARVQPTPGRPLDAAPQPSQPAIAFNPNDPVSLEGALARLKSVDPSFGERSFLDGAKSAFRLIVDAFAAGNRPVLKPLLSEDVFQTFDHALNDRQHAGESLHSTVFSLDASIDAARLTGTVARITVSFRSTQTNLVRDAQGTIIDGDAKRPDEIIDVWTFSRDLKARDPNWTLTETRHRVA